MTHTTEATHRLPASELFNHPSTAHLAQTVLCTTLLGGVLLGARAQPFQPGQNLLPTGGPHT